MKYGNKGVTTKQRMQKDPIQLYLDLMKKCLSFFIWGEIPHPVDIGALNQQQQAAWLALRESLADDSYYLMRDIPFDPARREEGLDHPVLAHTMVGLRRLDNIQFCAEDALAAGVPGDLIETGVWRGGASIFMRAILQAHQIADRNVWVADSFQGLPPPDEEKYPADKGDQHYLAPHLAVSLETVKANFARYDLLDDQVRFLPGWFKDTLPVAPIERIAVMRLDGDMYESTMDALTHLYPKLSPGGFVIVDDYGYLESCRQAVNDYRQAQGINDPIWRVDWTGAYWQRGS
jgi:hypothetical protein